MAMCPTMPNVGDTPRPDSRRKRIWKRAVRVLVFLVLAAIALVGWLFYHAVSRALQAENSLLDTLFTIRLVEQFVAEQRRWPSSWAELEAVRISDRPPSPENGPPGPLRIGGAHGYDWPVESAMVQRRVSIDFAADATAIARQDPMSFTAIAPIGPRYEYRDYGFVESLQMTIRKSVEGADGETSEPTPNVERTPSADAETRP